MKATDLTVTQSRALLALARDTEPGTWARTWGASGCIRSALLRGGLVRRQYGIPAARWALTPAGWLVLSALIRSRSIQVPEYDRDRILGAVVFRGRKPHA